MAPPDIEDTVRDPDRLRALREAELVGRSDEAFDRITRLSREILEAPVALLSLLEEDRQLYKSCRGLPEGLELERRAPLGLLPCKHVVASGEALVVSDAREHPLLRDGPAIEDLQGVAYLGMPLETSGGFVVGTLCVIDHRPRAWSEEEVRTLRDLARLGSAELDARRERTRRHRVEQALERRVRERTHQLRRSRRRFRKLFTESPVGIAIVSREGRPVEVNRALAEMLEYEPDQLREMTFDAFTHPDDVERDLALYRKLLAGEIEEYGIQKRYVTGSDEVVWADLRVTTSGTGEGGDRHVLAFVRDVTEQKRRRRALERAKEKFEGVFETSPVALAIVLPRTGEFLEVNRTLEEIFGHDRGELLAGEVRTDDLWDEPSKRRRTYERLRRSGRVRDEEVRFRRGDGTAFDALYSASVLELDHDRYLVAAIQDISRLKQIERELEHRSLHDPLTELPNRTLFWDRLEHALARSRRTDEEIAVFFIDVDGFKRINDEYGHAVGDDVLRQLAGRLRDTLRSADTLARLGGDEFGLLLEDLAGEDGALEAARRLTSQFDRPVRAGGQEAPLHLSCGIALAGGSSDGQPGVSADDLVHRADRAMYAAKEQPGSAFRFYEPAIDDDRSVKLRRELELREALETGEIRPHYQPIVDLDDGRIVGAEVLARWIRSGERAASPGEFIPLAEETGLIVELGRQVTRSACRDLSEWEDAGLLFPGFRLHVNLSTRQLVDTEIVDFIARVLRDADLDPELLAFEVTEGAAMESGAVLERIRELGPRVVVDDFGTEYATLRRLAELDLDGLKLDRLFVGRLEEGGRHRAVVEASLTLAASLDLCAVAEGVETEEQRRRLLELGCRYAQGFLFSKAVPAEELAGCLARRS